MSIKFTGERVLEGSTPQKIWLDHVARYKFASKYIKNKNILDIACGTGYGSKILLDAGAQKVIGIDISEETIDYAKKNYKRRGLNFITANAINLNFIKNENFDAIISFETIEHIKQYPQYLKEIYRLLKKEGVYIVSTPNKKYTSPGSKKPLNPFHVIEFYKKDFLKLLNKYFKKINLYGQNPQKNKMKKFVWSLLPKNFQGKIIPKKIKINYIKRQSQRFINKNVENCRYFIAICKK